MPNDAVSRCCSRSRKWPKSAPLLSTLISRFQAGRFERHGPRAFRFRQTEVRTMLEIVGLPGDYRSGLEILGRWRRCGLPLEASRGPRIRAGPRSIAHRPNEIANRQQITQAQNRGSRGGKNVEHLKLRRIRGVAPRHSQVAQNELRKERQVETDEQKNRR